MQTYSGVSSGCHPEVDDADERAFVTSWTGAGPDDSDLALSVRDALDWDVFVRGLRLRCSVSSGWVTLEGTVEHERQRAHATRLVRGLAGVRGVTSRLVVAPRALLVEVRRAAIEAARTHGRDGEPVVLSIELHEGDVAITGALGAMAERIASAVRSIRGVREVRVG